MHSTSTFASVEGVEYRIYVTGWSSNAGTFELSVDCACPNDYPEISCGDVVSDNTANNGVDNATNCGYGLGIWYTFVGTGDQVTFSTCNANTNYDTYLSAFTDCGEVLVECNDDNFSCGHSVLHSRISIPTVQGQDYQI